MDSSTTLAVAAAVVVAVFALRKTPTERLHADEEVEYSSEETFCACATCRREGGDCSSVCDGCATCVLDHGTKIAEGVSVPSQCAAVCAPHNMDFIQAPSENLCGGMFEVMGNKTLGVEHQHAAEGLQAHRKFRSDDMVTPLRMEADPRYHTTAKGWRPMEAVKGPAADYVTDGAFKFEPSLYRHQTSQRR